jgi:integration host factor subunit alpha
MTNKAQISATISQELNIPKKDGLNFLNFFIELLIIKSKSKNIKIAKFGNFIIHRTAKRIGRNPKTKESYIIKPMNRLIFKPSKVIKKILN